MRYEAFLFTRNQRQDFTAFIRPARLTNKDVSTIAAAFNSVGDVSRLTPRFPGLYCFRLGAYILLLRHYNSGRTHAGRAIPVIEGVAVQKVSSAELAQCIPEQHTLLNIMGTIADIEEQSSQTAEMKEWYGLPFHHPEGSFVDAFLKRRAEDRLFLPFSDIGLDMLKIALADQRMTSPPFFAFGTNSEALAQLDRSGTSIDIVSFLNTDLPCFRNRVTNRLSANLDGYEDDEPADIAPDPSMSVRPAPPAGSNLLPAPGGQPLLLPPADDKPPIASDDAVSIRTGMSPKRPTAESSEPSEPTTARAGDAARPLRSRLSQTKPLESPAETDTQGLLTLRQMRDKVRAEEAARAAKGKGGKGQQTGDPIRWLRRLLASLLKPK